MVSGVFCCTGKVQRDRLQELCAVGCECSPCWQEMLSVWLLLECMMRRDVWGALRG